MADEDELNALLAHGSDDDNDEDILVLRRSPARAKPRTSTAGSPSSATSQRSRVGSAESSLSPRSSSYQVRIHYFVGVWRSVRVIDSIVFLCSRRREGAITSGDGDLQERRRKLFHLLAMQLQLLRLREMMSLMMSLMMTVVCLRGVNSMMATCRREGAITSGDGDLQKRRRKLFQLLAMQLQPLCL